MSIENETHIKQILDGWANVVKDKFNILDPATKILGESRMKICDGCSLRIASSCSTKKTGIHLETGIETKGCGCGLAAKTLSPNTHCPLAKW